MSRTIARAMVALTAAAALAAGLLIGAQTATAAVPITSLSATPKPPATVVIKWDAFGGATDHYQVIVQPGDRKQTVSAPATTATFEDLSWGSNYTATVTALDSVGAALSDPTELKIPGVRLSAKLNKPSAVRGTNVVVSGTLRDTKNKALGGKTIKVQVALAPYQPPMYQTLGKTKTKPNGTFTYTAKADRNAIYRVLYSGKGTAGGWDANMVLGVRVPISMRFSSNPVPFGQAVTFRGALDCPASLVAGAPIKLQQRINGKWKTAKATKVTAKGKYAIVFTPPSATDRAWRVLTQAGPSFAKSTSVGKPLVVR